MNPTHQLNHISPAPCPGPPRSPPFASKHIESDSLISSSQFTQESSKHFHSALVHMLTDFGQSNSQTVKVPCCNTEQHAEQCPNNMCSLTEIHRHPVMYHVEAGQSGLRGGGGWRKGGFGSRPDFVTNTLNLMRSKTNATKLACYKTNHIGLLNTITTVCASPAEASPSGLPHCSLPCVSAFAHRFCLWPPLAAGPCLLALPSGGPGRGWEGGGGRPV